jgi:hypothetical protein
VTGVGSREAGITPGGSRPGDVDRVGLLTRVRRRAWALVTGTAGVVSGIAPHLLHHVGPIAGAGQKCRTGGSILFGLAGLVVSVPFLFRLRRRFGSWRAPAIALVVFAGMFTLSTLVIGPAIRGERSPSTAPLEQPVPDPHGH